MWTDPYPGLFRHHPFPYDQNQEPKEHVCSNLWTLETLSQYLLQLSACVQTCFRCTNMVRTIEFHFSRTNNLEYITVEKGGVRSNRVYELLEILRYIHHTLKKAWAV